MFTKGSIWVNGHNIGRFWTNVGPQRHLYVPSVWLKEGENEVVVFEVQRVPDKREFLGVEFVATPLCESRNEPAALLGGGHLIHLPMFA